MQEPKRVALRELILLALHRAGNTIKSETGNVTSVLRERVGIVDSDNNRSYITQALRAMDTMNDILRDTRNKRTYEISMDPLSVEEVARLESREMGNKLPFGSVVRKINPEDGQVVEVPRDAQLDKLVNDCERGLDIIRQAASKTDQITSNGLVAISVGACLRTISIRGQWAEEVKYYLRELGLAKSVRKSNLPSGLWYWEVPLDKPFDEAKLRSMATGDKSFLHHQISKGKAIRHEDTPVERAFAGRTPAVMPSQLCSEVTIRRVEDASKGTEKDTVEEPESEVTSTQSDALESVADTDQLVSPSDRVKAHRQTTQRLIDENRRLKAQLEERDEAIRKLQDEKATADKRATEAQTRLTQLENEIAELDAVYAEADALIADNTD